MDKQPIDELELRAIVDYEIRSAMGEIGGELAEERSAAMDYYLGEPVGKLANPSPDRSSVVITTVRDTVEWLMPQLMRIFAQADNVVEFEPVGQEDDQAAKQETQAINHVFWRQNEGFLICFTWFKDALLQKNGVVKYWLDETEDISREEHDGLTDQALSKLLEDPELEALEHDVSEIPSIDGSELHHVVFQRTVQEKKICIEVIPPEEFLVSNDARSLDLQDKSPRFVGHYTEKTLSELRDMGFSEDDLEAMKRGDERWNELDEEWIARYHLSDEQEISDRYAHESMRRLRLVEGYMRLDIDGDGYAELVKIIRVGEYISYEGVDSIPFASLTPNILSHKFFGLSVFDLVHDLQEIATATTRNVLDNMYQVNNTRPVVNERVNLESLLTSRPGAPIYVDDDMPVDGAVSPFAPPPMWKDGLGLLEYLDGVRKDRTGVGDETMGLDPQAMANANTGVVLSAIEAARGKIELIARIFAETGMKWLFRGVHELARKGYDQNLRYQLSGQYQEVDPREWRRRTNLTVNVGTATGSRQQEQFALQQVAAIQEKMVQGGLMGKTVIPSNIYQTGKDLANNLGLHGEKFFLNPMLLASPEVQQILQLQIPQSGPDPQMASIQAMAQAEQMKVQVAAQKLQAETQLKEKELQMRHLELSGKEELATMKQQLEEAKLAAQTNNEQVKASADIASKNIDAEIKLREQALKGEIAHLQAEVGVLKATTALAADLAKSGISPEEVERSVESEISMTRRGAPNVLQYMEVVPDILESLPLRFKESLDRSTENVAKILEEQNRMMGTVLSQIRDEYSVSAHKLDSLAKEIGQSVEQSIDRAASRKKVVEYDDDGKIISIG